MKSAVGLLLTFVVCRADKLLAVFEVTRHGARGGLHTDYFNESSPLWRPGELTQVGKRQHYLMGVEVAKRYKDISLGDVYVRSTDVNRTIESAQAHMMGVL